MKKAVFHSIMALVVVLGLTLSMATPVAAGEVQVAKDIDPYTGPYQVGDTIPFVMTVTNPLDNPATNTLTRIWDTLPNGTVIEFLGPSETLVLAPGQSETYAHNYTVAADDLIWLSGPGYWGVRNRFEVQGEDSDEDLLYGLVERSAQVIPDNGPPPVGGTASPVSRLALLVPWIVLAGVLVGAAVFVWSRRAQGRA